ncbi:acyl-CoA carboxylase subunit beta [Amycolatopsis taiwanensis]|uniref:acyl-CoA carboxylase subunit beta n=1 Tax=Amycolatopsis taiwanensis TaxID=342230 RepID=UPI0004877FD5|nr:carboxyl transferase domain-containing protein [Amycolatopsis taiwanensis]
MNDNRQAWQPLLDELRQRRAAAMAMGGPEKLAKVREAGRLDARARIDALVDADSFVELGTLAGDGTIPADAFVAGSATIDGRPVLVGAEDFTVAGGSIGTAAASKRTRLAVLARQERVPLVMMAEGAGHRATNALSAHRPAPNDLQALADLAGIVPTVTVVTGPSAGHGALAAPLSDFTVMVAGDASLFTAGPPLVHASVGENVDKEELGGSAVHAEISGVAQCVAPDVHQALAAARRYLSYLPSNAWQPPPFSGGDTGPRTLDTLLEIVPPNARRPYDMRAVCHELADAGSLFEIQPGYGPSLITALCRLGGCPAVIVANQPMVLAGAIDVAAAEKAARFVERMAAFGLPLVMLADNPGVLAGSVSERAGILRSSARMFAAQHRAAVPKLHVTLRKAFGFGSSVMGMNSFDAQTVSLAFPGATLGGIPAAVGGATAKADERTRRELIETEAAGPWRLAGSVTYDEIIDPRELRNALLAGLRLARSRLTGAREPVRGTGYLP